MFRKLLNYSFLPVLFYGGLLILFSSNAYGVSSLYVRASKSYLTAGDSVRYAVMADKATVTGYTGNLEIQGSFCPATNFNACTQVPIQTWKDYTGQPVLVTNGNTPLIPLGAGQQAGFFRFQLRPLGQTGWDWSNTIQINIDTVYNLEDASLYWNIPSNGTSANYPATFRGTNFSYNLNFLTTIGFKPTAADCDNKTGQILYIMKDKQEAYWDPLQPNDLRSHDRNVFLRLILWERQPGWQDNYLWARGDEAYDYNPADMFNLNNNFLNKKLQYRFNSNDPTLPAYIFSPQYMGTGWGISNKQNYVNMPLSGTICTDTTNVNSQIWAVHGDILQMNLPNYTGPALRLKFYEASPNWTNPNPPDGNNYALREDWYLVKNLGLVKIATKRFGHAGTLVETGRFCLTDPDCVVNEEMQSPEVVLTRDSLLAPFCASCPAGEAAKSSGNANCDGKINAMDFAMWKKVFLNPAATEIEKAAVDFNCQATDTSHTSDLSDFQIWAGNYH